MLACVALLLTSLVGCSTERLPDSTGGTPPAEPRQAKTLTVAIEAEPLNLIMPLNGAGGTRAGTQLQLAVHQRLVTFDDRGQVHPMLALNIPAQERGTWTVRPDGTMQTIYHLRPAVTWHDGAPLVAADFMLAWTVARDREIATTARQIADQIRSIETPDQGTLVMEWSNPYPFAHSIVEEDLGPLPAHLLGTIYATDKERFQQLPYWTREFVGTGPFRLTEWEPGTFLVLDAYSSFHAGRPKLDTLIVRFIDSEPAVTASLLAGTVDGAIPRALSFAQAWAITQQWEHAGKQPVVISDVTNWRKIFVQFRNPNPPEILDVRVRRGLLHAIDRQALVDALFAGQTEIAHTFIPRNDPRWTWIQDTISTYEFDPQRGQQLLHDAGWQRTGAGPLQNAAGETVTIPITASSAGNNELEVAIIADNWKALGIAAEQVILSGEQARDSRLVVSFPAFNPSAISLRFQTTLRRIYGPTCPTEQTRWVGSSIGCYQNPEMDRVIDRLWTAVDPTEQRELWRALMRIQTAELPVLPLYFEVKATLFRDGAVGVKPDTRPSTSATWNVAEWDLR